MPIYRMQVRDLVHGIIRFTDVEQQVVDHPLFQRLRNVRQADLAYYVYPSSHISRFEHMLGACHVAGLMAENLTESRLWRRYLGELKAATGISSKEQFVQVARLYALFHDIGHMPFSHLFERAMEIYAEQQRIEFEDMVRDWFGDTTFDKPHEALGSIMIRRIVADIGLGEPLRTGVLRLMTEKEPPPFDPLWPLKLLVDSQIDADRIDFVARDGLLAGGEYGTHDIARITSAVFLEHTPDNEWCVAYSEKALGSLEALLYDRYRTYVWINFHHRGIAVKLLARFLMSVLLERGIITNADFLNVDTETLALRDDVWLTTLIRELDPAGDERVVLAKRALLLREKRHTFNLWRNRPIYEDLYGQLQRRAQITISGDEYKDRFPEERYGEHLARELGLTAFVYHTGFRPVEKDEIPLYDERQRRATGRTLRDVSELVQSLQAIWEREPQFYVVLLGDRSERTDHEIRAAWLDSSVRWLRSERR